MQVTHCRLIVQLLKANLLRVAYLKPALASSLDVEGKPIAERAHEGQPTFVFVPNLDIACDPSKLGVRS